MTVQMQVQATAPDLARLEQFATKVATDRAIAYNGVLAYLGDRLGLWRALASVTDSTSEELAERCGLAERHVREWLATEAAAGYLEYDAGSGRYRLPLEHAMVLADDDSPAAGVAGFQVITAVYAAADQLAHSYVTGEGVAWHEHDPRLFSGVDRFFRTLYRGALVPQWLPSVEGLVERLETGVDVIDVGCGLGSATILMAETFPRSRFVGVDSHPESIRLATAAAEEAGVAERVRFEVADAASYAGRFDVVCFFDAVHDMGDPVGALAHARSVLTEDGVVMAVEPFAHDRLEDGIGDPVALTYLAASSCLCVPHSLTEGGAALGAQAGPRRLVETFVAAGFDNARVAATTPYNLVLEARA
jgi:SAM-dependent methyltransferase